MNSLKLWRPRKFADIVGAVNQPSVHRLQAAAKQRRLLKGILLGPYGTVKTSIARLLLKSCLCKNPDPVTADPCHLCDHCKNANADHNGEWFNYQYWEVDCTQKEVNREFISGIISQAHSGLFPPFLIFDELQRMHERSTQESLLKFTEDLEDGVVLAVVMTDEASDRPSAQRSAWRSTGRTSGQSSSDPPAVPHPSPRTAVARRLCLPRPGESCRCRSTRRTC